MLALWMLCSAEAQGRRPENDQKAYGGSGASEASGADAVRFLVIRRLPGVAGARA